MMETAAVESAEVRVGGDEAKAAAGRHGHADPTLVDGYHIGAGADAVHIHDPSRHGHARPACCSVSMLATKCDSLRMVRAHSATSPRRDRQPTFVLGSAASNTINVY